MKHKKITVKGFRAWLLTLPEGTVFNYRDIGNCVNAQYIQHVFNDKSLIAAGYNFSLNHKYYKFPKKMAAIHNLKNLSAMTIPELLEATK